MKKKIINLKQMATNVANFSRIIVILSVAFIVSVPISAQEPTFNTKGENLVGASIGFGGYFMGSFYRDVTRIPFIALYYENCVKENLFNDKSSLGIGGMLGYTSVTIKDFYRWSYTVLGVRGVLHYALVDKLDTYGGVAVVYNIFSSKYFDDNSLLGNRNASSGFNAGLFIGARYYFNEKAAVFAEAGFGAANLNIGLSIKF